MNNLLSVNYKKYLVLIPCNCTVKESCTQVSLSCYVFTNAFHASWHAFHCTKACIILFTCSAYVSEKGSRWPTFGCVSSFFGARVDQVLEKVHTSVMMLWSLTLWCLYETNLLCNAGKPRSIQPFLVIYKCFYYLSPIICALSYRDWIETCCCMITLSTFSLSPFCSNRLVMLSHA
jgi:hypothetical protein